MWHKADWEEVEKNPELIKLPRENWIFGFDAEQNAKDRFDQVVQRMQEVN